MAACWGHCSGWGLRTPAAPSASWSEAHGQGVLHAASLPDAFWLHGFGDPEDQCRDPKTKPYPRPCELGTSPGSSPGPRPGWLGEQEGCSQHQLLQLRMGKLRHGAVIDIIEVIIAEKLSRAHELEQTDPTEDEILEFSPCH